VFLLHILLCLLQLVSRLEYLEQQDLQHSQHLLTTTCIHKSIIMFNWMVLYNVHNIYYTVSHIKVSVTNLCQQITIEIIECRRPDLHHLGLGSPLIQWWSMMVLVPHKKTHLQLITSFNFTSIHGLITLKIRAVCSFKTTGRNYPTKPHDNPEDLVPLQSCYENLKLYIYFWLVYLPDLHILLTCNLFSVQE